MAVPLRGCSTVCSTSHGSLTESHSNKRRKKSCVPYFHCDFDLARQSCRNFSKIDGLLMVLMVAEGGGWRCLKPMEMSGFGRAFLSRSRNHLVTFCSFESGLVCEEELSMSKWNGEEPQTFDSYEGKVQPWVTPAIPKETSLEPRSNLSPKNRRLNLSRIKLHFLEERDEEILSNRILNLSRSNKARSALELYASMLASELRPNAHSCNSLLSCLVRNGLLDDALQVFETMRKKEMATGHTYSLILKAVASAQGCDSALEMFRAFEGEDASRNNFDAIVYNTIISVCGKARNWVETEKLWTRLKQNALSGTTVTYCLLVSTFVQCGQTELALDAYNEMIQNGLEPGEDVMKAMVASCTKEGKWTVALNVFQKMLDGGAKLNMITYNAMINCLGKAGETDLAFKIYDLMKSSGHIPDAYTWNALLSALYRSRRYVDALQLFVSIEKEQSFPLNVHLYNTALMSCQRLGLWERSLQLLWQMETSGMLMLTESYNHVIRACEAARKPKVALQVYQHMVQQKCAPDTFTYLSLIRACVWGSLWTEVEEILENVAPNASLYNAIIHGFCLRGKITLAKKLYAHMRSRGLTPDGKTRALMLQHLPDDRTKKQQLHLPS